MRGSIHSIWCSRPIPAVADDCVAVPSLVGSGQAIESITQLAFHFISRQGFRSCLAESVAVLEVRFRELFYGGLQLRVLIAVADDPRGRHNLVADLVEEYGVGLAIVYGKMRRTVCGLVGDRATIINETNNSGVAVAVMRVAHGCGDAMLHYDKIKVWTRDGHHLPAIWLKRLQHSDASRSAGALRRRQGRHQGHPVGGRR